MSEFMNAMGDPKFWGELGGAYKQAGSDAIDWFKEFKTNADRAAQISGEAYPKQAWDSTQRNALRHSLWTGMNAQHLGGGVLGGEAARVIGGAWESLRPDKLLTDPAYREDTRHDLNANDLGIEQARKATDREDLVRRLTDMAANAEREAPPAAYRISPGHLTYSKM